MIHERHFTVEEANELLPRIEPALRALREASARLTESEAREALKESAPTNGGGNPGRQIGEAFLEVRSLLVGLQGAGLVVRDVGRGLIDFPAILEGREVYLCWELGEEEVGFWHDLDTGYDGRTPLE